MNSLRGTTYPYSDMASDPMSLNCMRSDLLSSKTFEVSSIPVQELVDAYRLFGHVQSVTISKAYTTFTRMINSNCHSLTAKKNVDDTLEIKIPDYSQWAWSRVSQFQPFELASFISNRLYSAIELPVEFIENEISILARYDEIKTVKIRVTMKLVLATIGKHGLTFSPICNETCYEEVFKKALENNAELHDRVIYRREKRFESLRSPETPDETKSMFLASITEEGSQEAARKKSRSDTDLLDHELHIFQENNLRKLKRNISLKYKSHGSSRASLQMMWLLGYRLEQLDTGTKSGEIRLKATIEIQDKQELSYRIKFTETPITKKRKTVLQSSV